MLRSGTQLSFFGGNATIWPDLYSACVANLGERQFWIWENCGFVSGEYQLDHLFMPTPSRMPHEIASDEVGIFPSKSQSGFYPLSLCKIRQCFWNILFTKTSRVQILFQEWTNGQSDRSSPEEEEAKWTDPEVVLKKLARDGGWTDLGGTTKADEIAEETVDCWCIYSTLWYSQI